MYSIDLYILSLLYWVCNVDKDGKCVYFAGLIAHSTSTAVLLPAVHSSYDTSISPFPISNTCPCTCERWKCASFVRRTANILAPLWMQAKLKTLCIVLHVGEWITFKVVRCTTWLPKIATITAAASNINPSKSNRSKFKLQMTAFYWFEWSLVKPWKIESIIIRVCDWKWIAICNIHGDAVLLNDFQQFIEWFSSKTHATRFSLAHYRHWDNQGQNHIIALRTGQVYANFLMFFLIIFSIYCFVYIHSFDLSTFLFNTTTLRHLGITNLSI